MRKLIYSAAPSLDGFLSSPPPSHDTTWIQPTPSIDFRALYARFDAFVMGRRTWEAVTSDPEFDFLRERIRGDEKGRVEVVVLSRGLELEGEKGVRVVRDVREVVEWVRGMKRGDGNGKGIWLMGGGGLAGECLRAGLVDGVEIAVMPVVLGKGVKMVEFEGEEGDGDGHRWYRLDLKRVERLERGVLMLEYDVLYGDGGENDGFSNS